MNLWGGGGKQNLDSISNPRFNLSLDTRLAA